MEEKDLATAKDVRDAIIALEQREKELLGRIEAGRYVSKDELVPIDKKFEELGRRLGEVRDVATSLASRFDAHEPTTVTLNRAAMAFEVPDDREFKGVNRTYYNFMALSPEELLGLRDLGVRNIPGMAPRVREWLGDSAINAQMRLLQQAQRLNDQIYITDAILYGRGNTSYAKRAGSALERMRSLKVWPEYERLMKELFRTALSDATSTGGADYVPTMLSANLVEMQQLALRVALLFRRFPMTSNVVKWPTKTAHSTAYFLAENTAETGLLASYSGLTPSRPSTNTVTFTAKKLITLVFASTEWDEDSIIPAIPYIQEDIAWTLGAAIEEAIVDGEYNAYTMDGATFNPAYSVKRAWNGLRHGGLMLSNPAYTSAANATLTDEIVATTQGKMGAWGVVPSEQAIIVGFKAYHGLRKDADYKTLSAFGPQAVVLTGQVGEILGSPVILSEKLIDMENSGKYGAGAAGYGTCIIVNHRRWAIGDRRALTIDVSDQAGFLGDQLVVRGTQRLDFEALDTPSATKMPVGYIYYIAS